MRGHTITADLLRKLYVDEGLSPRAIGKRLGLGETAVRRHLLALGVSLRSRSEAQQTRVAGLNCATLTQLYAVEGLSQIQITAQLRCSVDTVREAMKRCQLPTRSPSDSARLARGVNIPEEELRRLYQTEGLSRRVIAKRYKCSETAVRNRMIEYGIAARKAWANLEVTIGAADLYRLYVDEGFTLDAIANKFGCSPATVSRHLKRFEISARPSGTPVYYRADFSGSLIEKAYLVGFRLGDLAVYEEGATIVIRTSTTKSDQISLLKNLFDTYGHSYIFQHSTVQPDFHCGLNASFNFLVPKADDVPSWVISTDEFLCAFMAGYIDAEGSFQSAPQLSIRSYDSNILRIFWEHWSRWGVKCPGPRVVTRAGYTNRAGVISRKDLWDLTVRRHTSLALLIGRVLPMLKHAKRRRDAGHVLEILQSKRKSKANL